MFFSFSASSPVSAGEANSCDWLPSLGWQVMSHSLAQWSPTFLAPGTGFVAGSFFWGWWGGWFGMNQAHCIHHATADLTGGVAQAAMWAMGSGCKYRWSFSQLPTAYLLLCDSVPSRNPGVGDPCFSTFTPVSREHSPSLKATILHVSVGGYMLYLRTHFLI